MKKSISDFVELQDYIEEEHDRAGLETSYFKDPSAAGRVYHALRSAILFYCREDFKVINLDDVETLEFETEEHNGKIFKFIYVVPKYKDANGRSRVFSLEYDNIIKAKQYSE